MTEILDLSKIGAPRDTVRLPAKGAPDGKSYELSGPLDFGLIELHRLIGMKDEADRLSALQSRTARQEQELNRLLGEAVKVLVRGIEPTVLKQLPRPAREQIILNWIGHHYNEAEVDPEGEAPSRRTTGRSSRGSKRSTAATRKSGSTSRATRGTPS